jgi:hypothetical protein
MGGGLMQLVAYGAQDIYLTGNPQITFFKVVYRRHTNFAMEAVAQTFSGSNSVGGKAVATVARNGDLVGRMYVEFDNLNRGSVNDGHNTGAKAITDVNVEIGGQEIDKHTGAWMEAWSELTEPNPTGVSSAAGGDTLFQKMSLMGGAVKPGAAINKVWVPLQFWFNRNPGLALPLIALQYHEVKVTVNFGNSAACDFSDAQLWADYIYLDTDERRRFAQVSHEYLIEQVQEQSFSDSSNCDLTFNHPVKELVWTGAWNDSNDGTFVVLANGTWTLKLNGHDRFAARDVKYFTRTQVWQHHTGHGGVSTKDSIAVYSFALKPEEHQPSGTCNFSRIDNAQLKQTTGTTTAGCSVYAVNYNVLRVMSGMGGLAYSN